MKRKNNITVTPIDYVFKVEFKSCYCSEWVERSQQIVQSSMDGQSPAEIAAAAVVMFARITEDGVRVTFLGLRAKGSEDIVPMSPFTMTMERK